MSVLIRQASGRPLQWHCNRAAIPARTKGGEPGYCAQGGHVMRARDPDTAGFVERDGIKVGYEVFGEGEPAVVFTPTAGIVNSRSWKAQVPYLARRSKVVTIDPRGNGRSDRPRNSAAYADTEVVADT